MESEPTNDPSLLDQLAEATRGLLMPSESDHPLTVLCWDSAVWGDPSEGALRSAEHLPATTPVQASSLEETFGDVIAEQPWFDDKDRAEAKRFRDLVTFLKAHLTDIHIYRIGKTNITLYVLGRTSVGAWVGLKTALVET